MIKIPIMFDYIVTIRDALKIAVSVTFLFCLFFFFTQPTMPIKLLALFIFLDYFEEKLDAYLYGVIRAAEDMQERVAKSEENKDGN